MRFRHAGNRDRLPMLVAYPVRLSQHASSLLERFSEALSILSRAPSPTPPIGFLRARSRMGDLGEGIRDTLQVCADALEAAAIYQELNTLSDAELARRGVPRQHLLRSVFHRLTQHT